MKFVLGALMAAIVLAGCGAPTSGDGWELTDRFLDAEREGGEIGPTPRNDGLQIVVATGSGGDKDCDLPEIASVDAADGGPITVEFNFAGDGCADAGGMVFEFVLDELPFDGRSIQFRPESVGNNCVEALVLPGYRTSANDVVDCG